MSIIAQVEVSGTPVGNGTFGTPALISKLN
jgi:hypothetical protein